MSILTSEQLSSARHSSISEDEIDLGQVAGALVRHQRLIAIIASSSLLLSAFYAYTRKPVWEGHFQIVLEQENRQGLSRLAQLAAANPVVANMAGFEKNNTNSLKTEVKILESPSVLKPIYDYVIQQRKRSGKKVNGYSFLDWLPSLKVELQKGTSVLNIAYQDTEKDLVLPVIERISETYQSYSGRDRSRGLTQAVSYLEEQLIVVRTQANKSMRNAQSFALRNGLGIRDGMTAAASERSDIKTTGSVESREAAQKKVNALQQQLITARAISSTSVYVAPQLEANEELYSQLQKLKADLKEKSVLLRANDPSIRNLERQIKALSEVINQQTIGLLQGQLQTAKAQLTSLTRPTEVVLRHRELVRIALSDEKTVAALEAQLQTIRLEKARQTEPWELISTPTLLEDPVAPRKPKSLLLDY